MPSSMSHVASPSSATLKARSRGMAQPVTPAAAATLHPNTHDGSVFLRRQGQENIQTMTPTSYQDLLLEQQQRHCRGILTATGNRSSMPLSARSNPTPTSTIPGDSLGSHAAPGQPIPRASSFGGFQALQRRAAPSSGGANGNEVVGTIDEGGPLVRPSLDSLHVHHHCRGMHQSYSAAPIPLATVGRPKSAASLLTSLLASSGLVGANAPAAATYHCFLSSLQDQLSNSPLAAPSPGNADGISPQETYDSIYSTSASPVITEGGLIHWGSSGE